MNFPEPKHCFPSFELTKPGSHWQTKLPIVLKHFPLAHNEGSRTHSFISKKLKNRTFISTKVKNLNST